MAPLRPETRVPGDALFGHLANVHHPIAKSPDGPVTFCPPFFWRPRTLSCPSRKKPFFFPGFCSADFDRKNVITSVAFKILLAPVIFFPNLRGAGHAAGWKPAFFVARSGKQPLAGWLVWGRFLFFSVSIRHRLWMGIPAKTAPLHRAGFYTNFGAVRSRAPTNSIFSFFLSGTWRAAIFFSGQALPISPPPPISWI